MKVFEQIEQLLWGDWGTEEKLGVSPQGKGGLRDK